MMLLDQLPPALILIIGALAVPFIKGRAKNIFIILLPLAAFFLVAQLPEGELLNLSFMGYELSPLRVDRISRCFGYIFTINGLAAFIYAFYLRDNSQHVSALLYIGSSLGVVFAGDLITLYVCWEVMAITSTFLMLARRTRAANGAGYRYVMVHIFGGLVLLAGIVLTIASRGSIAFDAELFALRDVPSYLVLAGFLINAAAPPLGAWLPDAYPEATVTGGVILSAYTSKTAVYTLIRAFAGYEILIVIGCVMAIYGIIYALLENDMRRILAYSIINQVGFMVVGVGIGTALAINGAVAHAFCHIIYKALLWMSAGAVLERTCRSKCTELGGLYKTMPWTMVLGTVGALAISAVPGTSGFTSKSMIIDAAAGQHLGWVWLVLEIASAGVFLHAGIKFPYFVFFAQDKHRLRPKEADGAMLTAMGLLAFLCLFLGMWPGYRWLYAILPYQEVLADYSVFHWNHIVTQCQLLLLSGLVFFLFLKLLKRTDTISLDTDWFYRKGGGLLYRFADRGLNGLNEWTNRVLVEGLLPRVRHFLRSGPPRLLVRLTVPFWGRNLDPHQRYSLIRYHYKRTARNNFSFGLSALIAILLLFTLIFL